MLSVPVIGSSPPELKGRPANLRTQFNKPAPPQMPVVPPNYEPLISKARAEVSKPIENETIPQLLKRLALIRLRQVVEINDNFPSYPLALKIGLSAIVFVAAAAITRPVIVHFTPEISNHDSTTTTTTTSNPAP